jgi:ribosomal protein S18 acetylase RimI-like enzyme
MNTEQPGIQIRRANEPGDAEAGVDIVEQAFDGTWSAREYERFLAEPGRSGYLAMRHGKPVGLMLLQLMPDHVYIALIATAPDHQGQGVGRAMLEWLKENLPTFERTSIQLHCRANNLGSNHFYQSNGYEEVGRSLGEYHDGVDAVIYKYTAGTLSPAGNNGD